MNFLFSSNFLAPILVIVEYCRYGNLCHFLRSKRESFIKENGPGENAYTPEPHSDSGGLLSPKSPLTRVTRSLEDLLSDDSQQDYTRISDEEDEDDGQVLTIDDLICYSFQISRGMEFLASKKVQMDFVCMCGCVFVLFCIISLMQVIL